MIFLEKFKVKLTLLATLIVTAYAFFNNVNFLQTCQAGIATIVIFYILGDMVEDYALKQKELMKKKLENAKNQQLNATLQESDIQNELEPEKILTQNKAN